MKNKSYTVNAKLVDFWVDAEILAASLEDAVQKANALEVEDFVEIHGDWIDGHMKIIGVIERF